MKILKCNSVKGLIACLLIILSVYTINADAPAGNLKKNQLKVFPNTNEAAITPDQVKDSNFKAPLLSNALNESDPTRKLRKSEFLETVKYALYKMTRGELEQIFVFVDQNKDDMIDHKEWHAFVTLFVLPFEACDKNKNNVIGEEEWGTCFDKDPKSKLIEFRRRYKEKRHSLIMSIVSTRGSREMNFSDYLFVKKALFGWRQCHSNSKYIAKIHFKCALSAAIPQKYYSKLDYESIFDTGLKLTADKNLIELDFVSYLRILYFTYIFGIFNSPNDIATLEKAQFLKAIKEDRFPNNFEESEIELIYNLINDIPTMQTRIVATIDFQSWCFFFHLHRLFNKYSIEKPLQLNLQEFLKMLNDPFSNKEILNAIDHSYTRFEEQHYVEASLILQRYRLNERDFFNARFKQDASLSTVSLTNSTTSNATYYTMAPNNTNREVFFSIFTETNKKYWTKANMFRSFQLANLYVEMPGDPVASNTFIEKLPALYSFIHPPINMKQRSNYVIYKALPKEVAVDILTFLALENFYTKFQIETMSSNFNVEETTVKIILKDYGMHNMPDTVLDLSGKGYDALHRRIFNPLEIAKNAIIVHAVASENMRNKKSIAGHKLKLNKDLSRDFPTHARRFESSERV